MTLSFLERAGHTVLKIFVNEAGGSALAFSAGLGGAGSGAWVFWMGSEGLAIEVSIVSGEDVRRDRGEPGHLWSEKIPSSSFRTNAGDGTWGACLGVLKGGD